MSRQLISRSPDLKRLQDDGFELEIKYGHLLITSVPYVNSKKEIKFGTLISNLNLAGDITDRPQTHVAHFAGEHPCDQNGLEITRFKNTSTNTRLGPDLEFQHSFSTKPSCGYYENYYEKMATYIAIISGPAEFIDPKVSARTFPVIEADEGESVFNYIDNASGMSGISAVANKLEIGKIAIVGLGGTGSYVLDLVAKTPVKEIHLYDGDKFSQHNAFRSPGAPSVDELRAKPQKVLYLQDQYSKMRRGIVANDCHIDSSNVEQLREMDFVFMCLDNGSAKKLIVNKLEEFEVPFIDAGMGIYLVNESLAGILRVTTSTVSKRDHVRNRVSFSEGDENDEYAQNIQVADLNALNAALAVIKWKKLCGFYQDLENEHHSLYTIDGNNLICEDHL